MSENLLLVISIVLVLVCYLVLHALLLRVREKTCVSDNRVLAACQERTMYHQLSDRSQVRSIDPTVMIGPRNVEARTILHEPAVSLSPGPSPHPSKRICPVHQEGSR